MAAYYLDVSAVVKWHVVEPGTAWTNRLVDPRVGHELYTVRLTGPEVVATLTRLARGGRLPAVEAVRAIASFRQDWQSRYIIVDASRRIVDTGMDIAEAHGLRGYDAVHVAAAHEVQRLRQVQRLPAIVFISADREQLRAAAAEGMAVDDPNQHP